ncbi:hypothetical protein I316_01406 [Kwoniella heveanensis BCC8398]|uniref:Uncharacterized protein n=1 Tax=Kwoniella heveanensis BCC8398 TaxID=1296120 RepID=A0A1B9H0N4_9TREE|nr:hypothetical protein I316_01406 [Kwoniella heveanensis BCC8398]
MVVVKREHGASVSASPSSADEAIAQAINMDTDTDTDIKRLLKTPSPSPSPKKRQRASPKKEKVGAGGTTSPSKDEKPRRTPNAWTAEEDAIFLDLMLKTLHKNLYNEIKADGRLERESPAVRAHLIAMMNRLKRGQN